MTFVPWRKARRSSGQGGACVEARTPVAGVFQVRDSKLGDDSPILGLDRASFASVIDAVKSGELDG